MLMGGLFLFLVASACKETHPTETFIQGSWTFNETVDDFASYQTWTFTDGKFTMDGYPPIWREGPYEVLEADEDHIKLKLTDNAEEGNGEPFDMVINIDKEKDQIWLGRRGPFTRVAKESK